MKRLGLVIVVVFSLSLLVSGFAVAADDSKVKNATNQVQRAAPVFLWNARQVIAHVSGSSSPSALIRWIA
jgi:hypothetical protein